MMIPIRRYAAFAVPFLLAGSVHAQTLLGPKLGLNLAHWNFSEEEGTGNTLLGFMGGLQLEAPMGRSLLFAPELIFIQKGDKLTASSVVGTAEQRYFFNYLEIPVLFKYAIGAPDRWRLLIAAGPNIGYLMNARIRTKITILGEEEEGSEALDLSKSEISRIDAGLCLGLGLALPMGFTSIRLEGRYQLGLINLDTSDDDYAVTNRGIQIGLALLFGTGKKAPKGAAQPTSP